MAWHGGWRVMAVVWPVVLAAGCAGGPGSPGSHLDARMQQGLAPQAAMHQASVQSLPDGARVTLAEDRLFAPGSADLNAQGRYLLASVIEGLLDPRLMEIQLTPAPATAAYLQQARVESVRRFFVDFALGPTLATSVAAPGSAQAFAITVHVLRVPSG